MEEPVSTTFEAISPELQPVIKIELQRRNPALLNELWFCGEPTIDQREAVEKLLAEALIENIGDDYVPNEHGLQIERAINAFLEAWPIQR